MQTAPPGPHQTVILGTAQWGLDYGITNAVGRPDHHALVALVATARELGLDTLDTAPAYGDAEVRIGRDAPGFAVQTKVSAVGSSVEGIVEQLRRSLVRLDRPSVSSVLVHDWPDLDEAGRRVAAEGLRQSRADGLVDRIGISAYTAADLAVALDDFTGIDLAQVPVSVLDQRLDDAPAVAALRGAGVRLQARSVFLQGLALAQGATGRAGHPDVVGLAGAAREAGCSRLALCLAYVRSRDWLDELVVAATTPDELREIVVALAGPVPGADWAALASADEELLDPRRWE
jgi:aryl-alcohol dehydrogenase-like predicted oxidoreductase